MSDDMMGEAKKLAAYGYMTVAFLDATTDGGPMYVAMNPELKGCMAQGDTVQEAKLNLTETRLDFILEMLEDGLPVPEPASISMYRFGN